MEVIINSILSQMQTLLSGRQLKSLENVLISTLGNQGCGTAPSVEEDLLSLFLTAKEVEGCSPKTIAYYRSTLEHMASEVAKPYTQVTSDDLRSYLADYEAKREAGKVTIDNIRRIMSSFFSWLEDEDYLVKSPVRRIHRVKTTQVFKEVLADEQMESLRDGCTCARDLAIVDVLASAGMRVGELVGLDIANVNLKERACIATGKGNKQRPVYFDARVKLHLAEYLATRTDDDPALFVSLTGVPRRMTVGNVEARIRDLGRSTQVGRVHPITVSRSIPLGCLSRSAALE